jgi:hypothetical protein
MTYQYHGTRKIKKTAPFLVTLEGAQPFPAANTAKMVIFPLAYTLPSFYVSNRGSAFPRKQFKRQHLLYCIESQSMQSARLSVQSSELGPPTSLTRKRVLFPTPLGPRGKTHSLAGEEVGDPIPTNIQTSW